MKLAQEFTNEELKQILANIAFPGNKGYNEEGNMLLVVDYTTEDRPESYIPFEPLTQPAVMHRFMTEMNISLIMKGQHCWAEAIDHTIPNNDERVRMSKVLPKTLAGRAVGEAVVSLMERARLYKEKEANRLAQISESMKTSNLLLNRAGQVVDAKTEYAVPNEEGTLSGDVGIILH